MDNDAYKRSLTCVQVTFLWDEGKLQVVRRWVFVWGEKSNDISERDDMT